MKNLIITSGCLFQMSSFFIFNKTNGFYVFVSLCFIILPHSTAEVAELQLMINTTYQLQQPTHSFVDHVFLSALVPWRYRYPLHFRDSGLNPSARQQK